MAVCLFGYPKIVTDLISWSILIQGIEFEVRWEPPYNVKDLLPSLPL